MKQHNLGPNGAIMTSLNLFSTKFDQVIQILEQRAFHTDNDTKEDGKRTVPKKKLDFILVDTPGQIEAFTWSASGSIVTEALATSFPTVLAYVVDTPRCVASLNTFMSNMLYACSMLYRSRLPLLVVFNKCDVVGCEMCMEWMDDFEKFQEAMDTFISSSNGDGYYACLTRSLSLVLDEFYRNLKRVGVSAVTGFGVDTFWDVVRSSCDDFEDDYVMDLNLRVEEQDAKQRALSRINMERLQADLDNDT
jgi:GTPase SAR1 family protein